MINLGVKAFTSGNQVIDLDYFPSISPAGNELWHLKNHFLRTQFVYRWGEPKELTSRNMFVRWQGLLAGVRVSESWWIGNESPTHQSMNWRKSPWEWKQNQQTNHLVDSGVRSWDGCSVPSWICVNCIYIVLPTCWIWPLTSLRENVLCFIRENFRHSCHAYFEQLFLIITKIAWIETRAVLERDKSISQFICTKVLEHFRNLSIILIPILLEYPFCMRINASSNKTNRFHPLCKE